MGQIQHMPVELSAVIVSISESDGQFMPYVIIDKVNNGLPSGPLETQHQKLEQGLRAWVDQLTGLHLGYVEQLYTFADKVHDPNLERVISIGYLALTQNPTSNHPEMKRISWYRFLPWEDHRVSVPHHTLALIRNHLDAWKCKTSNSTERTARQTRIEATFPTNLQNWDEELVLPRYELLWEAGLIEEAVQAGRYGAYAVIPGLSMPHDHRRILATALTRLRAKIKYRPVVFELMPPMFTLLHLQQTVEALAGLHLHKQNFRRLVQGQGLVEETAERVQSTKGRPAKLFSFRRSVLNELAAVGTKLPKQ